ncbi:unnamed protein product [Mytilus edulis]|uniref:Uncharacterized protein n=1 Tax=Mytilus edulis TaxID=6550 RepID=A0A8S3T0L9_MYTED|nr:unnamed protein product [Mytilus edulis]
MKTNNNQELNQSRDTMALLKEEVKSITHLKSINQLQDVKILDDANATGNHLHFIYAQLNKITATQQARDQDLLALYNQTVFIQTSLTQKLQKRQRTEKHDGFKDESYQVCSGFYLVIVKVMSDTDNGYFRIFKNASVISNGFVSQGAVNEQNTGTSGSSYRART